MTTLQDSIEIRAKRAAAYKAGKYRFSPPPVYSGGWDAQAWMNWISFDDPALTGFLPYVQNYSVIDGVRK